MMATKRAHSSVAVMQTAKLARTEFAATYAGTTLTYKVTVSTGGGDVKSFSVTLLDSENRGSDKILVKKPFLGFGKEISFDISVMKDLRDIVQVKIDKENSQWFCKHIRVKSPSGNCLEFPCYRWLNNDEVIIREGHARLPQDDTELLKKQRKEELVSSQEIFRWNQWRQGFPQSIDATLEELPVDVKFDEEKQSDFRWNLLRSLAELGLDWLRGHFESWKYIEDFGKIFEQYSIKNTLLGNIYIADYEILQGVPANKSQPNTPYYLTAPMCLLYNNRLNQIVPIAIQLLIPHVRFTIAINAEARENLVSEKGVFSKISSVSGAGIEELMKRAMETLTYKSLCFPEAIKARGMEDTPKYHYRDDGMKIWEAINCFVADVVKIYYDSDETVQKDEEIQAFVKDVSCFGMNDCDSDRFPKSLKTRVELTEYLSAVIFTASAQHSAVNFGQFDWYGWIPNSPSTMRKPPPQQKGQDLEYIMKTLPNRDCSSEVLGTVWLLTRFQDDELFLGTYPNTYFTEQPAKEAIKTFRKNLNEVANSIKLRNEGLTMGYCYLSPDKIPNSVAI